MRQDGVQWVEHEGVEGEAVNALTLKHPWPWAIIKLGKRIENRTWRPVMEIGAWYAIHGGKIPKADDLEDVLWQARELAWEFSNTILRGTAPTLQDALLTGIVALARHGGVVKQSDDPWFEGPFGWVISELIVLPEAIPCRGAQGLWKVPLDIADRLARIIDEVEATEQCPQH